MSYIFRSSRDPPTTQHCVSQNCIITFKQRVVVTVRAAFLLV